MGIYLAFGGSCGVGIIWFLAEAWGFGVLREGWFGDCGCCGLCGFVGLRRSVLGLVLGSGTGLFDRRVAGLDALMVVVVLDLLVLGGCGP